MKKMLYLILLLFLSIPVMGGTIQIITLPNNASVYINVEYYNQSPCIIPINESWVRKSVIIQVNKTGYNPENTSVFIPTTEYFRNITLKLAPVNGTLYVHSTPPGAVVYVNGTFKGTTPLNLSIEPANYNVTLALQDYLTHSTLVEIPPGKATPLNITLVPLNGTLIIISTPSNASVYINWTFKGTTPLNLSLEPGVYLINVTKDGSWNSTTISVEPNKTYSVDLTIPEKGPPLAIIFGVFLLLAGGGAVGYFLMTRQREEGPQEPSKAIEEASLRDVTTVKSRDGKAFGISHVGSRDNNEDNLLVMKLPDAHILAVADGLGGHNAGEVASQMAVDTLREVFGQEYRKGMSDEEVKGLLGKAYKLAHERISENAVGEREGMGTTLVTAFVRDGKAIIANTGDSRAYLIRNVTIVARTKDHSLVQELIDKGEITPEEAKRHPMRNIITKALGIDFGVDFYEWELEKGDILLLSSDGLHDYVEEDRIVEIALSSKRAEDIGRKLVEEALPVTKDNVTVVVLRW